MKATTRLGVALAAVAAALSLTSTTAQATPDPTIQTMVDEVVAADPGARRISADTVRLANGVEMTATKQAACPFFYLCVYDQEGFLGWQLSFFDCGFVNIGNLGWSDRIRSFVNNQTTGTVSIFMNWTGSSWQELYRSMAFEASPTVASVRFTDGLWVC